MSDVPTPADRPQVVFADNGAEHRFQAVIDGHTAAAYYQFEEGSIRFTHTIVPEELRGRGLANDLVAHALADVRGRGLKVTPQCPVFAAYMRRHAESQDLLTPEGRSMLGLDAAP
jgi:predicted GNAT family acetyltransferase